MSRPVGGGVTGADLDSPHAYVLISTAGELAERYGSRWSIEPVFHHMRQDLGAGEARNRTQRVARRLWYIGLKTIPE
ncbi:transposase [Streptomyces sp. NPDC048419]|uniref:transposase n=1 Tax=Streptomyces sp. NPDC048419 TaxID=3365547 RepID=UPI00372433CE